MGVDGLLQQSTWSPRSDGGILTALELLQSDGEKLQAHARQHDDQRGKGCGDKDISHTHACGLLSETRAKRDEAGSTLVSGERPQIRVFCQVLGTITATTSRD